MSANFNLSTWISDGGPEQDVVLSSRIRLARNIEGIPFPNSAGREELQEVTDQICAAIKDNKEELHYINMSDLPEIERGLLVEKNMVSPEFSKKGSSNGILINDSERISVMINEEDHYRIQVLMPGLQLNKAFNMADELDDEFEKGIDYAFSKRWGYLTACPTNLGTGLRSSVMVHLPALNITDNISKMLEAVSKLGLVVRGIYGEGSKSIGNIYQISNQTTMGSIEQDIINNLKSVTQKIIEQEKNARNNLMKNDEIKLKDKIKRSFGILKFAHTISSKEAMKLLSDVKLGIDMGIISDVDTRLLSKLIIMIRPYHLQKSVGNELSTQERDVIRAELIQCKLNM